MSNAEDWALASHDWALHQMNHGGKGSYRIAMELPDGRAVIENPIMETCWIDLHHLQDAAQKRCIRELLNAGPVLQGQAAKRASFISDKET